VPLAVRADPIPWLVTSTSIGHSHRHPFLSLANVTRLARVPGGEVVTPAAAADPVPGPEARARGRVDFYPVPMRPVLLTRLATVP